MTAKKKNDSKAVLTFQGIKYIIVYSYINKVYTNYVYFIMNKVINLFSK